MKAYLLLFLGYLLLSPLHSALAASQESNLIPREREREEQTRISDRQASDIARSAFEGKVISVRRDRQFWRVRIDVGGTVMDVLVHAETGAVSRP